MCDGIKSEQLAQMKDDDKYFCPMCRKKKGTTQVKVERVPKE